jgi:lipoate-protein ligase A
VTPAGAGPAGGPAGSGGPDELPGGWLVTRWSGSAADLHGIDLPADGRRHVWVLDPDRPALVLGSTQDRSVVDEAALAAGTGLRGPNVGTGIETVVRRSGGGAVLLVPGRSLWVDVVVPRGDPLWDDDVTASFAWLGRVWQAALAAVGIAGTVHGGPPVRRRWGRVVCFAGVGSGEVVVDGRKVVGLSQRRTRSGARFQAVAEVGTGDPPLAVETAALLAEPDDPAQRAELLDVLRRSTGTVPAGAPALVTALLAALPTT